MIFQNITEVDVKEVHWTDLPMVILDLYPTEVVQAYCEQPGAATVAVFTGRPEGIRLTARLKRVSEWRTKYWRSKNIDFVEPEWTANDNRVFKIDDSFQVIICSELGQLTNLNLVGAFVSEPFIFTGDVLESIGRG